MIAVHVMDGAAPPRYWGTPVTTPWNSDRALPTRFFITDTLVSPSPWLSKKPRQDDFICKVGDVERRGHPSTDDPVLSDHHQRDHAAFVQEREELVHTHERRFDLRDGIYRMSRLR